MSSSTNWDTSQESVVLSSKWSIQDGWQQTAMSNIWEASVYGDPDGRFEAAVFRTTSVRYSSSHIENSESLSYKYVFWITYESYLIKKPNM